MKRSLIRTGLYSLIYLSLLLFPAQLKIASAATQQTSGGQIVKDRRVLVEEFSREDNLDVLKKDNYINLSGGWEQVEVDGYRLKRSRYNDAVIEGTFSGTRLELFARLTGQGFELELDEGNPQLLTTPDLQKYGYFKLLDKLAVGVHHFRLRLANRADGQLLARSLRTDGDWIVGNYPRPVKLLGYGSSTVDGSGLVWELCKAKHWEAINRGIGGTTVIREGQNRLGYDVLPFQPDVVVINYGSNDWREEVGLNQFQAAYHNMLIQMAEGLPRTNFVVVGIFTRQDGNEALRGKYNRAIQEALKGTGLSNRAHYLEINNYSWQTDSIDGIHPNLRAVRTKFVPQILPWLDPPKLAN